jgi:hypothetical protein
MKEIDSTTISLQFRGRDIHRTLSANVDMTLAIWSAIRAALDTSVVIWAEPQTCDTDPLEWYMTITSPSGRRTCTVSRRTLNSSIMFSDQ